MNSRYPNFDVLDNSDHWDEHTAQIVRQRILEPGKLKFFNQQEARLLKEVCSRLLGDEKGDRIDQVVRHLDKKLHENIGEGYRKINLPESKTLYRQGLANLNETARLMNKGQDFIELDHTQQNQVIQAIADGSPPGNGWLSLPARDFFKVLHKQSVEMYCSLPGVWSEMGYAGPAYPRGYVRIELGATDPWEAIKDG